MRKGWILVLLSLPAAGCGGDAAGGAPVPDVRLAGGATTVANRSINAFSFPAANLSDHRSDGFFVGNSLFKTNWVIAPASSEGRDGLGPFYNAVSCSTCHLRDGRGRPPETADEPFQGLLLRISVAGKSPQDPPHPHPVYGDQIQPFGIPGVAAEGRPRVAYEEVPGQFEDGTMYSLRRPTYTIEDPAYGPLPGALMVSPRVAPQVFGLGLLETIPESRIRERADEADADGDGISGRPNVVPDRRSGGHAIGRFGWKANQPTVEQQTAGAFLGDIGITSPLFPEENFSANGKAAPPNGGSPELDRRKLGFITFYMKTLAVPARRNPDDPEVRKGREVFFAAGCNRCHTPRHSTGSDPAYPELSRQTIFPYTDLLLHDMGPGLADGRPDHRASGSEWRTPPLWGIGLVETVNGHTYFLHDGRARNLTEAILWHGGEAERSREHFRKLPAEDRRSLLAFLNDL